YEEIDLTVHRPGYWFGTVHATRRIVESPATAVRRVDECTFEALARCTARVRQRFVLKVVAHDWVVDAPDQREMTGITVEKSTIAETSVIRVRLLEHIRPFAARADYGEALVSWHGGSNAA